MLTRVCTYRTAATQGKLIYELMHTVVTIKGPCYSLGEFKPKPIRGNVGVFTKN